MLKAYEYRIYPTEPQKVLLSKHFGCARWVYNYGLALKNKVYKETSKGLSSNKLSGEITKLKKEKETEWLSEVNAQSLQMALRNLDNSFTNFFKKKSNYPVFRKKHNKQSFQCPQAVRVDFKLKKVYLPKFKEGIKAVFHREFVGKIKTVTVKKSCSEKYYVSVLVDDGAKIPELRQPSIKQRSKTLGLDMGIKSFMVDSEGNKTDNPKFGKKFEKRIVRESRRLSRKVKGSKNRNKQRIKLTRIHEKLGNKRKDFLHKLTRKLVDNKDWDGFAVENLAVTKMMKNKRLSKSIGDCSWAEFKRMLEYKAGWAGKYVLEIGQFEPSSKMCGKCSNINRGLKLNDRIWTCPKCSEVLDRDLNAACNIRDFAIASYEKEGKKNKLSKPKNLVKIGADCPELGLERVSTLGDIGDSRAVKSRKAFDDLVPVIEPRKKKGGTCVTGSPRIHSGE